MAKQPHNRRVEKAPPTENKKLELQNRLHTVLGQLRARRDEIENVLPIDVDFDNFYATVNQALRNNPDVLDAEPITIVNACVKAAYDGLRPDGREAAIVVHNVNVGTHSNPSWEKHAQYFPMVFGLIQQILRGGEVLAIEAEVVYQNDTYRIQRGTDGKIEHEPIMDGDPGEMLFAYTVATLKSGIKTTAYLRKHEILDVMKASKSGCDNEGNPKGVWKRWPRQMWLKTVLRFHRKTLPLGDRQIRDMEQRDLFPDMQQRENPLGLQSPAAPRPTRQQAALEDRSAETAGTAMDFGNQPAREEEPAQSASPRQKAEHRQEQENHSADAGKKVDPILPVGDEEWNGWLTDFERKLVAAKDTAAVESLIDATKAEREAAPAKMRDWVANIITERLAELASDAAADPAQGAGSDNDGPGAAS